MAWHTWMLVEHDLPILMVQLAQAQGRLSFPSSFRNAVECCSDASTRAAVTRFLRGGLLQASVLGPRNCCGYCSWSPT